MGIYFIPAGTKNRDKTLDRAVTSENLRPFLNAEAHEKLKFHFPEGRGIYAWGTDDRCLKGLKKVSTDEYVVDVKKDKVVQVFSFCFFVHIERVDEGIQDYLGWDKLRDYQYVYFLKKPQKINESSLQEEKEYFQNAFNYENNHWLNAQKYFSDDKVSDAMQMTSSESEEEFLGITSNNIKPAEVMAGTHYDIDDENQFFSMLFNAYGRPEGNPIAEEIFDSNEIDENVFREIKINAYEQDLISRESCIQKYGVSCFVCDFNFEEKYGGLGKDYIHIHHLKPIADLGKECIPSTNDLRPVCANCHSMIHRNIPPFSIDEVKQFIKSKDEVAQHKYFKFSEDGYGKYLDQKVKHLKMQDNFIFSEKFSYKVMKKHTENDNMELVGLCEDGSVYIDREEKVIGLLIEDDDVATGGMIIEVSNVLAMLVEIDGKDIGLELDPRIIDEIENMDSCPISSRFINHLLGRKK